MIFDQEPMKKLIKQNLLEYVGIRSDTNSKEEKNIENFFEQWFSEIEYFQKNHVLWFV